MRFRDVLTGAAVLLATAFPTARASRDLPTGHNNTMPSDIAGGLRGATVGVLDSIRWQRGEETTQRLLQDEPTCEFEEFVGLSCTIREYCAGLFNLLGAGDSIWCSGNPRTTFFVQWTRAELCYNDLGNRNAGQPYNAANFNTDRGACVQEIEWWNFTAPNLELIALEQTYTRPASKRGRIDFVHRYERCSGQTPDVRMGNTPYCRASCPTSMLLNGVRCNGCRTCISSNTGSIDCSNVNPLLLQTCGSSFFGSFIPQILSHYQGTLVAPATNRPTARPTTRPTLRPTQRPTPRPTPRPTQRPTQRPTPRPTQRPTARPTQRPTPRPTSPPVVQETRRPTSRPTPSPTPQPTRQPTPRPTSSPTVTLTENPTPPPVVGQTPEPTPAPTFTITGEPTFGETDFPTRSFEPTTETPPPTVSIQPTWAPTPKQTEPPVVEETIPPTTIMPVSIQNRTVLELDVIMRHTNGVLRGDAAIDYEKATEAHIRNHILQRNDMRLLDLTVTTQITTQLIVSESATFSGSGSISNRQLQSLTPLEIISTVVLRYEVFSATIYNPVLWVSDTFNSDAERTRYIQRLKETNPVAFSHVTSVALRVNGVVPTDESNPTNPVTGGGSSSPGPNMISIVAGLIAGVAVVMLVGLVLFVMKRQSPKDGLTRESPTDLLASQGSPMQGFTSEIIVDRQDDISTLGDPIFGPGGGMALAAVERDERTASVVNMYDYTKEYLLGQDVKDAATSGASIDSPSAKSSILDMSRAGPGTVANEMFADDASFEEQFAGDDDSADAGKKPYRFEAEVPPGKLGMVLDTPNGSPPIVHAIKPDSVLFDKVQVGDLLLSVDGEDVRSMSAIQVSKLISIKSDRRRLLCFARNGRLRPTMGQ